MCVFMYKYCNCCIPVFLLQQHLGLVVNGTVASVALYIYIYIYIYIYLSLLLVLQGMEQLPGRLAKLRQEYSDTFLPYFMEQRTKAQEKKLRHQQEQLERFAADSSSSSSSSSSSDRAATPAAARAAHAASDKKEAEG